MKLPEVALGWAVLKALADIVKAELDEGKPQMLEGMAEVGAGRLVATLPDGTHVADVTAVTPEAKAKVMNQAEWLEWLGKKRPDAVQQYRHECPHCQGTGHVDAEIVDERASSETLATLLLRGDLAFDPDTGDLVPGVAVTQDTPYLTTKWKAGGKDAIREYWRAGHLYDLLPNELPPGPAPVDDEGKRLDAELHGGGPL